jgi:hypothetical protein
MRALFVLFVLLLVSCNKNDEPQWHYCNKCTVTEWLGDYKGEGTFYSGYNPNETKDVEIDLSINILYDNKWKIIVSSEENFIISFIGNTVDSSYYYSQAGSTKSINLTLYEMEGDYKITGNAKTYQITSDSTILKKSVSFNVIKLQ